MLQITGRSRRRVAAYCSSCRRVRRAMKRSIVQPAEAEQPQFLARGRIDRQPVGVVGIALRGAHLLGVAIAPDRALAQQPVRRQPRAGEHDRRPPGVARRGSRRDAMPPIISTMPLAMKSMEIESGGPVIPRSKSRATVRSLVSVGIFEVPHARRTHAGLGEPVVEPGGGAIAEVGADRLMNRAEHLQQDEDRAGKRERTCRADRRAARRRRARPSRWRTPPAGSLAAGGPSTKRRRGRVAAFGRTLKNFHSLRSVSRPEHVAFCLRNGAREHANAALDG